MTLPGVEPPPARQTITTEGQDFMVAVPGAAGQVVRTGRGEDRAAVTGFELGSAQLALIEVGFPAVAEAVGTSDAVILCTMLRTPPGGRWDGVPLAPGQTFVYPAGSTHHARDPAGLRFALSVLPAEVLESGTRSLGFNPDRAGDRPVVVGGDLPALCERFVDDDEFDVPASLAQDHLVDAAIRTICGGPDESNRRGGSRWQDGELIRASIAFLEHNGRWIVPMLTLCRHVHVSERRLQIAFGNLFGIGPNAYMRYRALQSVHQVLRDAEPDEVMVSEVARRHDFRHLGRFAGFYSATYGEAPSSTLRRRR